MSRRRSAPFNHGQPYNYGNGSENQEQESAPDRRNSAAAPSSSSALLGSTENSRRNHQSRAQVLLEAFRRQHEYAIAHFRQPHPNDLAYGQTVPSNFRYLYGYAGPSVPARQERAYGQHPDTLGLFRGYSDIPANPARRSASPEIEQRRASMPEPSSAIAVKKRKKTIKPDPDGPIPEFVRYVAREVEHWHNEEGWRDWQILEAARNLEAPQGLQCPCKDRDHSFSLHFFTQKGQWRQTCEIVRDYRHRLGEIGLSPRAYNCMLSPAMFAKYSVRDGEQRDEDRSEEEELDEEEFYQEREVRQSSPEHPSTPERTLAARLLLDGNVDVRNTPGWVHERATQYQPTSFLNMAALNTPDHADEETTMTRTAPSLLFDQSQGLAFSNDMVLPSVEDMVQMEEEEFVNYADPANLLFEPPPQEEQDGNYI